MDIEGSFAEVEGSCAAEWALGTRLSAVVEIDSQGSFTDPWGSFADVEGAFADVGGFFADIEDSCGAEWA